MNNDTLIKKRGMAVLSEHLGLVNAERFITLMLREPFDYTKWQRGLYKDVPLNDFLMNARNFRANNNKNE